MNWFRFYSKAIRNPKIRHLDHHDSWVWLSCLCLANDTRDRGRLWLAPEVPASIEDIADAAHTNADHCTDALDRLLKLGLVQRDGDVWVVTGWDEYQYTSDNSTERTQRFRGITQPVVPEPSRKQPQDIPGTARERFGIGSGTASENRTQIAEISPLPPTSGGRLIGDHSGADRETAFQRFWQAYPRKDAKKQAARAFAKVCKDDMTLSAILAGLESIKQSDQWRKEGGKFIPLPSTWLSGRRWEDEGVRAPSENAPPFVKAQRTLYHDSPFEEGSIMADMWRDAEEVEEDPSRHGLIDPRIVPQWLAAGHRLSDEWREQRRAEGCPV